MTGLSTMFGSRRALVALCLAACCAGAGFLVDGLVFFKLASHVRISTVNLSLQIGSGMQAVTWLLVAAAAFVGIGRGRSIGSHALEVRRNVPHLYGIGFGSLFIAFGTAWFTVDPNSQSAGLLIVVIGSMLLAFTVLTLAAQRKRQRSRTVTTDIPSEPPRVLAATGVALLLAVVPNAAASLLLGLGVVPYELYAMSFALVGVVLLSGARHRSPGARGSRVICGTGFLVAALGSLAVAGVFQLEMSWQGFGFYAAYFCSMAAFVVMGTGLMIVAFGVGRYVLQMQPNARFGAYRASPLAWGPPS